MSDVIVSQGTFDQGVEDLRLCTSNQSIREWYKHFNGSIAAEDRRWSEEKIGLRVRAQRAWSMRHLARMLARLRMAEQMEVRELQERDLREYGSPHGPSFEELVAAAMKDGATEEQAYQMIVAGAQRTNAAVDSRIESKRKEQP